MLTNLCMNKIRDKMNLSNINFLELPQNEQKAILESLIFASDETLSLNNLFNLLIANSLENEFSNDNEDDNQTGISNEIENKYGELKEYIKDLIDEINVDLKSSGRPYEIVSFAGGFQFATRNEYGKFVFELLKSKTKKRLSQAALESLSIIAYKQPISKPEIEQIRGVNSNEVVNSLIDKGFVKIAGRSKSLGKPLLYSTTQEFLRAFGLNDLNDMPKLRELEEIAKSELKADLDDENSYTIEVMEQGELNKLNDGKLVNVEKSDN